MSFTGQEINQNSLLPIVTETELLLAAEERFWKKVARTDDVYDCWLWQAASYKGYGKFWPIKGQTWQAHQYSLFLDTGIRSDRDNQVHHHCGNTLCVNPYHLELLSVEDHNYEELGDTFKCGHLRIADNKTINGTCLWCFRTKAREKYREKAKTNRRWNKLKDDPY